MRGSNCLLVGRVCLLCLGWLGAWVSVVAAEPQPADELLVGGRIITLDAENRIVEALALRDGRIVAAGSEADVRRLAGPGTRVTPLAGRTVIPGIVESHSHAHGAAITEVLSPFVEVSSIGEIQAYLRQRAREVPPDQWIMAPRCDRTRIRERRLPTRDELDAACATHPVLFAVSSEQVLNSRALELLGIDDAWQPPRGVEVHRDPSGRVQMLRHAMALVQPKLPSRSIDRAAKLDSLERLFAVYNSVGITLATERGTDKEGYETYRALAEAKRASLRLRVTLYVSGRTEAAAEESLRQLAVDPRSGDDRFRPAALKIRADGGALWGTAATREPYGPKAVDFYFLKSPDWRGQMNYTVDEMAAVFRVGTRQGWSLSAHVTGEAGVDQVLDAVERVAADEPIRDKRFCLIHAYWPDAATAARCVRLGVTVDTQPAWYYKDADALASVFGGQRMERFIGLAEWLRAGVPTAANTDHMIGFVPDQAFNPFNPFLTLWIMVARRTQGGQVFGPEQRIDRLSALRAMTLGGAYLTFDETRVGSLEPGKYADLAVLDRDYLTCPEDEIRQIQVLSTRVEGREVYRRP